MTCETARGIRGLLYISHSVSAFSLSSSDILVHGTSERTYTTTPPPVFPVSTMQNVTRNVGKFAGYSFFKPFLRDADNVYIVLL